MSTKERKKNSKYIHIIEDEEEEEGVFNSSKLIYYSTNYAPIQFNNNTYI